MTLRDLHRQLLHDFNDEDWRAFTLDLQRIRRIDPADYQRLAVAFGRRPAPTTDTYHHEGEKAA
jgi:hypothetical protein